jgi:hypothetical protein
MSPLSLENIVNSRWTSSLGGTAIAHALYKTFEGVSNGLSLWQALSPNLGELITGCIGLVAKDSNVTGGTRQQ